MRILLVGALSWNPERLRSLGEQGHRLWGLWSRSMAWDQGPYPALDGCIRSVRLADAARTIREERIECVYSLFQVYHPRLWGPPSPGVEHGVWTLLRALLRERAAGAFDAPIVGHWGFDLHALDLDVIGALDGHLLCNRQKYEYLTTPRRQGGRGIDAFAGCGHLDFLDSDRPKLEFMNDRFAAPLPDADGEIHTVCIGRPFNVDYVAAARRGIHVHIYGNRFDDVYETIARDLTPRQARRHARLLGRYLHVHPALLPTGASWPEIQQAKSGWVEEFSGYDAAWSYIGAPHPWEPLEDRAAIPNKLGTYLLAGLPVIADVRPGFFRYDELRRLGVEIGLDGSGYDGLRDKLAEEVATRAKRARARERRTEYSFDATVEPLLGALERARGGYLARPHAERTRFDAGGPPRLVHLYGSPRALARHPVAALRREWRRRLLLPRRARRLARDLRLDVGAGPTGA